MQKIILYAISMLLLTSCVSSGLREDIDEPENASTDRINFTNAATEDMHTSITRSSQLTTGFLVSGIKAFGLSEQKTIMERYSVEYRTSGNAWDGTQRPYWTYVGVGSQFEKYWDYSNFPYRFHAVAPARDTSNELPVNADGGSYAITSSLSIPATFWMQTCRDGQILPLDAEPCLVAQVQRNTDGTDTDIFANKSINQGSTSKNRDVRLPFHHLNSKVRFGIYSTSHWTTANPIYVKDLSIKVVSRNFITQAGGYQVNSPDSWYSGTGNSGFTNIVTALNPTTEILHYTGGKGEPGNDLSHAQGPSSIFWLQDAQGFMQIPQEGIQMTVSFKLYLMDDDGTGTPYMTFTDLPVKTIYGEDTFHWKSGYFHTYNIIISDVENKLEINFTATLTPWEDVGGSLETDLEK